MKNKEHAFITALGIIIVICVIFWIVSLLTQNNLKKENLDLKSQIDNLKKSSVIPNELMIYYLNEKFEQDCRYRNYSFYNEDNHNSFCCKWVNNNRICMDWLSVVSRIPITINPYNFIQQNATILIQSDMGYDNEITITLKNTKYDCRLYQLGNQIEIRCNK